MALFSNGNDGFDLEREMAALRREVAALGRSASKRGAKAYQHAGSELTDIYDDVAERLAAALPVLGKRARSLEHTIRDNPTRTVAVVGLAALAVTAAVLFSGRRR